MELLHINRSAADLVGAGPVLIAHRASGLTVPLRVGQEVVVTDDDGEFHAAVVLAVLEIEDEWSYQLRIGVRLPADLAAERIADLDVLPERTPMHDLLDLLGDLRRAERDSAGPDDPAQR